MLTKNIANAVGGKTARACDSCVRKRARWYCAADDAFLCQSCDSAVHSANPLARRHQRLRLNTASSKPPSPSWVSGFTRKPRTPRPRRKSDDVVSLLSNPSFSLVPEADEGTWVEENEEDHLLYRVPTFEPFVDETQSSKSMGDEAGNFHGFLPSDLDLEEFAADVESLLGRNLESECFDMEGLGIGLSIEKDDTSTRRVKVEEDGEEANRGNCRFENELEAEVDLMREPFELNLEEYEQELKTVGVKKEREEEDCKVEEDKLKKKRKVGLQLDCDAVIAAWGNDKSPWTTGERPDLEPDNSWPHCVAICGVRCGEYGGRDGGREARVSRYREKRRTRLFSKKIRGYRRAKEAVKQDVYDQPVLGFQSSQLVNPILPSSEIRRFWLTLQISFCSVILSMAGRNRSSRHIDGYRVSRDVHRPYIDRVPAPLPIHPAALEEELDLQHREMQRIISDNRMVIDDNTILQRELSAAKEEIHRLNQAIPKILNDKEAQSRELLERGLKLEAELRASEPLKSEVMQLRSEIQKLNTLRQDLSSQVQSLTKDVTRLQAENQQLNAMRADMDGLHKELIEARRAYEYEKKANEEQIEQKQVMEKNLVSMAREIEKLRAEKLNIERARGLGAEGYGILNRSPEMRYAGGAYGNSYGSSWAPYEKRSRR
ncbi:Zinc finger protein CONSTANS-LIKE 16, partial [Cucurbita argyrosperma subsp. sororia]